MGWTFGYSKPSEIKQMVLNSFKETGYYELIDIKSTQYGKHMWVAIKNKETNQSIILLYLIQKNAGRDGWGYKDMDESMGPYVHDCPLELIEKTTGDGREYSINWRKAVVEYHATRKHNAKANIGDVVEVYGKKYKLIEKIRRSWRAESLENGRVYNIRPSQLQRLEKTVDFITNSL